MKNSNGLCSNFILSVSDFWLVYKTTKHLELLNCHLQRERRDHTKTSLCLPVSVMHSKEPQLCWSEPALNKFTLHMMLKQARATSWPKKIKIFWNITSSNAQKKALLQKLLVLSSAYWVAAAKATLIISYPCRGVKRIVLVRQRWQTTGIREKINIPTQSYIKELNFCL